MKYYDDGEVVVRDTEPKDVPSLAERMRADDVHEIWASNHVTPQEALEQGMKHSVFCATVENGRPIAMFGVAVENLSDEKGSVWLLASDDLFKIKKKFLQNSRHFIDIMLEFYPRLENYVHCNNIKSIRWLKMCGAKLESPELYGVEKEFFQKFVFERKE